jgi:RecQ family ATP-dependent DNA helicase
MPTGGGKSMCYQLPALLFEGLTVVVSPLIALMQDQVDALQAVGAPAAFLNSTVDYRSYLETANAVRAGKIKLLYMAPETLIRPETLVMLDKSNVECITIDEAHCISSWGHDFRPEYRQLLPVRQRYPRGVCLALTATATRRVQDDIKDVLGFGASNTFVASFNRPNLSLRVEPRLDRLTQIMAFLDGHQEEAGIIYTNRRRDAELLAAQLTQLGRPALPYHAGMDDASRRAHQRRFTRDEAQIIVATIAFGMGINKSNVRFILHTALPENLENYYQQVGRAGRDGLPAECLLLWGKQDIMVIRKFIRESAPEEQPGKEARLQAMLRYAEREGCRRAPLLAYFGEKISGNCGACDHCLGKDTARPPISAFVSARLSPVAGLPSVAAEAAGGERGLNLQRERALFEELRKVRLAIAREAKVPPFVVFSDKTLQEMAQKLPQTESELRAVSGVGDKKLATYGAQFLEAVRAFCATQGASGENAGPAPAPGEARTAEARTAEARSAEMGVFFNSGLSAEDLARLYGVQTSTILRHLVEYAAQGHRLDGERLLPYVKAPDALRGDAFALFTELGVDPLRPVYDALGGKVSYDDLRLLRIYFQSQHAGPTQTGAGAQPTTKGLDES